MKARLVILCILVAGLALTLVGTVAAQPLDDDGPPGPMFSPDRPQGDSDPRFPGLTEADALGRYALPATALGAPSSPAVALGQPGLSFRYVRTFGTTEVAYFDDTTHVCGPNGVGTNGTNVWIAECEGSRALRYASDGTFSMQIGKAGFRYFAGTTLDCLYDVAVDGSGNIWVVDRGAHHIVKFNSSGSRVSELGSTWNTGTGNDRFNEPNSIAFDNAGNIYVSDSRNHRIQIFNSNGVYTATIGVSGVSGSDNAHFNRPAHITIDNNNLLYVADANNHRVQIFSAPARTYVATLGVSGVSGSDNAHLNSPQGIAVDVTTGRIYVADANNKRVQVFDHVTRAYQTTLSGFSYVADVAIDSAGNLYVAEPWTMPSRVQQFNSSLAYVRTFGTANMPYLTDGYHYSHPSGVVVAPDGSIYIGESIGRRLIKLNAAGAPQWVKGEPGIWGSDNDHFTYVEDVALDATGRVYAVDRSNCRVQIYNSDGSYYATLGTGCGSGNDKFNQPRGVAVGPGSTIYVADTDNHRVQVYDSSRAYVATLGVTTASGSDNAHFNGPVDVEVDSVGNVYVADQNNHRVQIFDSSRAYMRTIGESGVAGSDFGHLTSPTAVAVDASGRVYVADNWGNSGVTVYDGNGAYLTTVSGSSGNRTGQVRSVGGVAVDTEGNLYMAEVENHRVQKFAPGVPGWRQVNINGFGSRQNSDILTLMPFAGQIFAGGWNSIGVQLWRMDTSGAWTPAAPSGFGDATNVGVSDLVQFGGYLYAGTNNADSATQKTLGAQIWRSMDGVAWERVESGGFGDSTNGAVFRMAVFGNHIYAVTSSYTNTHSSEVWRSSSGNTNSWQRVVENAFGDTDNRISAFEVSGAHLYAGTWNDADGAQVWRSADGASWAQVNATGFNGTNTGVISFAEFHGQLYAGTRNWTTGAQLWRCTTCDAPGSWSQVMGNGFGDGNNGHVRDLYVQADQLYATTYNEATGLEVWRTSDGVNWTEVGGAGLGDSNNRGTYFDRAMADFNGHLFVGTQNYPNGAEIWMKTLTADFTATPTRGAPPLAVQFVNTSAGDFTTSQWDFGDGGTSTTISPTHAYTAVGTYTVTLTVGDGMDTSAITKTAYIDIRKYVYLPLVTRNYGPVLYDDFNNPTYDDSYDHDRWAFSGNSAFTAQQQAGALVFTNVAMSAADGAALVMQQPTGRSLRQLQQFEARLKVGPDHVGSYAFVDIQIYGSLPGHSWWTQCRLGVWSGGTETDYVCDVARYDSEGSHFEYVTPPVRGTFDTWHTARIEADPDTANLRFYLDGNLVGSFIPTDAAALRTANDLKPKIGVWNDGSNTFLTRYVDDVRITPAR